VAGVHHDVVHAPMLITSCCCCGGVLAGCRLSHAAWTDAVDYLFLRNRWVHGQMGEGGIRKQLEHLGGPGSHLCHQLYCGGRGVFDSQRLLGWIGFDQQLPSLQP
jgi:hypothetical protein